MKSRLLTLVGGLALVVLLGHFYAKPLLAQVRAALIQNVDEPGRNPFELNFEGNSIGFASFTVPAGKRYVIESFSAFCTGNNGIDYFSETVINGGNAGTIFYPVFRTSFQANGYFAIGNTKAYAEPGSTVNLNAGAAGIAGGSCTYNLWGYSINLP